jgi:Fic family protein
MEYSESPFKVIEGQIKECFKRIEGGDYELADTTSGEVNVFRKAAKNKRVFVDTANYVKIYKEGLLVASSLGFGGKAMFLYIALNIMAHKEDIYLPCDIVCKWCGISRRTYYRSLSELLDKNIIARKKGSSLEFFVNINYVFNGSRLKV